MLQLSAFTERSIASLALKTYTGLYTFLFLCLQVLALNGNMLDAVSLAVRAALVKTMYEYQ